MATLESYQLTHPELLSENDLRDVLENCCIDMSVYQNLCKSKLVEIYKRIAMPLPQRKPDSKESNEPKQNHCASEKNGTLGGENQCSTSTNSNKGPSHCGDDLQTGRLKPPVDNCSPKKIRLPNTSKTVVEYNGISKRKNHEKDEDSKDSPSKKRQKITWP